MHKRSLSILVPSFNSELFLKEAIDSALSAIGPDDEIVIQDGGSTDRTLEILDALYGDDERVKVVSERDSGQADALNRALARSSKDFVMWLNADDIIYSDALHDLRVRLDDRPSSLLGTAGHRVLAADGSTLGTYRGRALDRATVMRNGCYVFSGSFLVDRSLLHELGGFDAALHYSMDLDLMFRLCKVPQSETVVIPSPLGALRRHDASKSGTSAASFVREGWQVRARYVQGWRDQARRVTVAVEQPIVSAAKPIRFSRPYRMLRDRLWRRNG